MTDYCSIHLVLIYNKVKREAPDLGSFLDILTSNNFLKFLTSY